MHLWSVMQGNSLTHTHKRTHLLHNCLTHNQQYPNTHSVFLFCYLPSHEFWIAYVCATPAPTLLHHICRHACFQGDSIVVISRSSGRVMEALVELPVRKVLTATCGGSRSLLTIVKWNLHVVQVQMVETDLIICFSENTLKYILILILVKWLF